MLSREIFFNMPALDIVCSPFLVGKELEHKAFEASKEFFKYSGPINDPI